MGLLTADQLSDAVSTAPAVPSNLTETEIPARSLLNLLLKFMHLEACETLLELADRLKIPRLVTQQLLDEAISLKFVQAVGVVPGSLGLSMRYTLSEAGRAAAKEALDQNLYMGPAPVSLAAYQAQVGRQRIANEQLDSEALNKGFEGLVVPEHYIRKLLPAVNAGRSVLLIDDFGRQKFRPDDLLNRWIVPMENQIDYLKLNTGTSFSLPFDVLLIFSTNLQPADLMDGAFLRRIQYKIKLFSPSREEYRRIFDGVAKSRGLTLTDDVFDFVVERLRAGNFDLAYYQPRFICDQVLEACKCFNLPPRLTTELAAEALSNLYFDMELNVEEARFAEAAD